MIDYFVSNMSQAKHPRKIPPSSHLSADGILVSLESSASVTDPPSESPARREV